MNAGRIWLAVAALGIALGMASVAQAGPIHHRQQHQRGRIAQGVHHGSLTPGETRLLRHEQAGIARGRQRALADGRVGPGEARVLTNAQNRASRHIYGLKHNGRTASAAQ
jgi:hypothetical protein